MGRDDSPRRVAMPGLVLSGSHEPTGGGCNGVRGSSARRLEPADRPTLLLRQISCGLLTELEDGLPSRPESVRRDAIGRRQEVD